MPELDSINDDELPQWGLSERVLFALCRKTYAQPAVTDENEPPARPYEPQKRFAEFMKTMPWIDARDFRGKRVIDYGCGFGHLTLDLGAHADEVIGLECRQSLIEACSRQADKLGIDNVSFMDSRVPRPEAMNADIIISMDSMEHFEDPAGILKDCASRLKPSGRMLITFGPPWLHPFGHHLSYMCSVPWFHLAFSEKTIMNVRRKYRRDGARLFREASGGMGRMTLKRFKDLVAGSSLKSEALELFAIRNFKPVLWFPVLHEMWISRISCVLVKKES
jgi:SAM-dependent methyltransferase